MSLDKYRNRIKNLLDRAAACEGTPEGDLCRVKAFELAAKYALDPDDVRKQADADSAGQTVWEWELTGSYKPQQRELLAHIASALHCRVLHERSGTGRHNSFGLVFGVPRHLERVKMLFPMLNLHMSAGSTKYAANHGARDAAHTKRLKTSWMMGFSNSVFDLLEQADQDTASQVGQGAEVALLDDASAAEKLMHDYVHEAGLVLRNGRQNSRVVDPEAMHAGSEEGRRVDLGNSRLPQRKELSA
ncbi:hypothetical protein QP940_00420 [Corynebacterium pseudodiphtheriticum]|uniref:DUF7168 domain-containing protein n=1 Tax=Corynebacterium pseudodiphtheriticum TaxID=37637 RepID=UPI00254E6AAA|nr:hypothetical protein [Corynebacterium pseudodiphtheriticum]MDK8613839.1 hypothetical protein [Corynebacterium pseudodiphtheriticum]MDK8685047.1 hypothetical protein [Corynebacterium pseudodiphtheriticum]MDK8737774.1 hypothetical protein [Corynebacterium pseudodiphtheriticum]MDK8743734.1 hypothetical protein [Corynebacterium pseudodiphtheriticum]